MIEGITMMKEDIITLTRELFGDRCSMTLTGEDFLLFRQDHLLQTILKHLQRQCNMDVHQILRQVGGLWILKFLMSQEHMVAGGQDNT